MSEELLPNPQVSPHFQICFSYWRRWHGTKNNSFFFLNSKAWCNMFLARIVVMCSHLIKLCRTQKHGHPKGEFREWLLTVLKISFFFSKRIWGSMPLNNCFPWPVHWECILQKQLTQNYWENVASKARPPSKSFSRNGFNPRLGLWKDSACPHGNRSGGSLCSLLSSSPIPALPGVGVFGDEVSQDQYPWILWDLF